jgi:two-component system sensor histidine kinase YesM
VRKFFAGAFKSLSVNVFLMIFVFLLIPMYISLMIIRVSYENDLQEELNRQIIENIKKGEDEFYQTFQMMTNISNVFVLDKELISVLTDKDSSYWDRNRRFDEITNNLRLNNLVNLNDIRITMFDRYNRNYANWGLYFYDYSGILGEEWVNRSIVDKGLISWNLFAPSFVQQENEQYISLARSVLNPVYSGDWMATIIISINQRTINAILSRNDMNADFIRVCTRETMEDIFALDGVNLIRREDLQKLLLETGDAGSGGMLCELDGRRYLLSYYTLDSPWTFNGQRLTVLSFSDYQRISENLSRLSRTINFRMAIFIVILIAIIGVISYSIAKPIRLLDKRVKHFTQTRGISIFNTSRTDEIGDLTRTFQDMEVRINDLFEKLRQESEIREQYRFQVLRAQINPHFLFNTLNTIRWMAAIRKADNIVDTINALSRILDYSMSRSGDMAALGDELSMIRSYAHIQNYRYAEDWELKIEIEDELLNFRIVRFILQPVVENAFIHAFRNRSGKKIVHITGQKEPDCLKLFVRDNGVGMDREKLNELREGLNQEDQGGNRGIGIVSVHRRIRAGNGGDFGLDFESAPGEGTLVIFNLPLIAAIRGGGGVE